MATLRKVRSLFTQGGWVQGSFAVDAANKACPYDDERACRFCVLGALLHHTHGINHYGECVSPIQRVLTEEGYKDQWGFADIANWNDSRSSVDEVLEVLDKAMALIQ